DPVLNWTINWGDGTESSPDVQTVSGNPSSVTHTFASGPNDYDISASVTTTFSGQSISLSYLDYGPFVLPNGQILVLGHANNEQAIFCYNANGTLDTSFG